MNEVEALHTLQHVSYFRLKSYLQPTMYDRQTHTYKSGATFEQAYELYKFDSKLRKLVIAEVEKIEVSVRTQMACISTEESGAFWFSDSKLFTNGKIHTDVLDALKSELSRSDDDNVLSFRKNYSNEFPPAWVSLEVSSFGTLSRLYKLMTPGYGAKIYALVHYTRIRQNTHLSAYRVETRAYIMYFALSAICWQPSTPIPHFRAS